ncbi:GNAT family N-acetyltransferase [Glycomyces buryatensis]|uniref:GNAT family N-acetyltransferase n=1 Tax=Glycomyces buryatensis TaxID=2570927 RepID=A0A4S8PV95_9ACTN|nr:GNAT family N-acetyltransferase [Glycomyces buryatensis]
MTFRPGRADEAPSISALALRSKGYWGYSQEFLDSVRAELTYSPQVCASGGLVVAERAQRVLGFYRLVALVPVSKLESLFVDPDAIGTGVGKALLEHALAAAEAFGAEAVTLDADPNAEPFYAGNGAVRTGAIPSASIPGRSLPIMRFDLAGASRSGSAGST